MRTRTLFQPFMIMFDWCHLCNIAPYDLYLFHKHDSFFTLEIALYFHSCDTGVFSLICSSNLRPVCARCIALILCSWLLHYLLVALSGARICIALQLNCCTFSTCIQFLLYLYVLIVKFQAPFTCSSSAKCK